MHQRLWNRFENSPVGSLNPATANLGTGADSVTKPTLTTLQNPSIAGTETAASSDPGASTSTRKRIASTTAEGTADTGLGAGTCMMLMIASHPANRRACLIYQCWKVY